MAMSSARHRWLALAAGLSVSSCQCPPTGSRAHSLVGDPPLAAGEHPLASDGDAVALTQTTLPGIVLVGGEGRNGNCLRNEVFMGSGTIDLGDRIEDKLICPSEVAAFTGGQAVELDGTPTWSHDSKKPLEMTMRVPVSVPIRLYVPSVWPEAQKAKVELDLATTLAAENRAGLVFAAPSSVTYSSAEAAIVGSGCGGVANLVLNGPASGLYDASVINVYYVYNSEGWSGANCYLVPLTTGTTAPVAENVIYISIWRRAVTTLTHELAHSLGMRGAVTHTNGLTGFTSKNLLMSGLDLSTTNAQDHFSLGQVYRMSLDKLTWLNHGAAPVRSGTNRTCQNSPLRASNEPCPRLALDP